MKSTHRAAAITAAAIAAAVAFTTALPVSAGASALELNTCDLSGKAKEMQTWDAAGKYNIIVWKESAAATYDLHGEIQEASGTAVYTECKSVIAKSSRYRWATFEDGTFVHQGDGGFRNYAYIGNFTKNGETITFHRR
ncbi:hypothetical protein [Kutzneria sp. 744]|uniref:hypothetical protein n=1 Tax=Kutzneria sp. (strain 744) TaxID=345341 RepID=UPI0003EEACDA|nr:hypothetical protein [Kutzneria sp. 744]EWM16631.1 hypothetical protein KUTG_06935 [Kutzneria sp. 744]